MVHHLPFVAAGWLAKKGYDKLKKHSTKEINFGYSKPVKQTSPPQPPPQIINNYNINLSHPQSNPAENTRNENIPAGNSEKENLWEKIHRLNGSGFETRPDNSRQARVPKPGQEKPQMKPTDKFF